MLNAVFKEQKENVHTHSLAILLSFSFHIFWYFPSLLFGKQCEQYRFLSNASI